MNRRLALFGGECECELLPARHRELPAREAELLYGAIASPPTQGLSAGHPIVAELEGTLAKFHGVEHCFGTSSGHGALHACLIGLEISSGDEVITSPYSWGSSVSCILHNNALPTFADVDPETGLLDPAGLEEALTPATRAILVPHIFGQVADMAAILAFARRHGLAVIEDGSHAHGARFRDHRVGALGDAAGFSVSGSKPLSTMEGGYLLTDRPDVFWNASVSCQFPGREGVRGRADDEGFPAELTAAADSLIFTYRLTLAAAILAISQIPNLDHENEARRHAAALFESRLDGLESMRFPQQQEDRAGTFHILTLNFDAERAGVSRDTFLSALRAEGVPAVVYLRMGLHRSPRLSPRWNGPRVMWTENLRRCDADPTATHLPGCDARTAQSIDISWHDLGGGDSAVESLARAFLKVEENLDVLRRHERATSIQASA